VSTGHFKRAPRRSRDAPPVGVANAALVVVPRRISGHGRAGGETFGDIRPATSGPVVHALIGPRWLVEIEAMASIQ